MINHFHVNKPYVGFPVQSENELVLMEIFDGEEKIMEFRVPACTDSSAVDYHAWLNLEDLVGKELTIKGDLTEEYLKQILVSDTKENERTGLRPMIHFSPDYGWINDPNGLVYHNGVFHLYFQYNPMDTRWENMSWGHAVSTDLLSFTQKDTVLLPDAEGTMYSGSAIVNHRGLLGLPKDSILCFYSVSGNMNSWSKGKKFTQWLAVSDSSGEKLTKKQQVIGVLEEDSRDPQAIWHEKSNAYVMPLWIKEDIFAVFRSEDLTNWTESCRFRLPSGFECPNMFYIATVDGQDIWGLMEAAGQVFFGTFDGYRFCFNGQIQKAYQTELPYAAQIYSNVPDRTITVPWMRTKNTGKIYTGIMGLPREIRCSEEDGKLLLHFEPIREYEQKKELLVKSSDAVCQAESANAAVEIELGSIDTSVSLEFFGETLVIEKDAVLYNGTRAAISESFRNVRVIIDRGIIEVVANEGTQNLYFETESDLLDGEIKAAGFNGECVIYRICQ